MIDFPEVIDSSLIAAARSCHQKAYREYFEHWKGRDPSVHLRAGGAYAHGLEAARRAFYEEGLDQETAVAIGGKKLLEFYGDFVCPEDSAKSASRTLGALEFYFDRYPMETDAAKPLVLASGKRAIEFNGVEPIDILHPVTGNPLLYSWRMDMVVEMDGMILGEDDKTASQLGASWPRQWDLRSQFTSYVWGAKKAGVPVQGFLVRGVSILKTKYDTMQAITYRPDWQIDRWYEQLLRDVKGLIQAWEEGYFSYNLDHACTEYGGCPFRNVCLSRDPQPVLEQFFTRRKWDPVTRTETPL
jgi:hypothetical protein